MIKFERHSVFMCTKNREIGNVDEEDALFQRLTSSASRNAADALLSASAADLNQAYRREDDNMTKTTISKSVQNLIDNLPPAARAAYDEQAKIIAAADQIESWRKQAGLTQQELADRLHIDVDTIRALEDSEDEMPDPDIMQEIAKVCGFN